MTQIVQIFHTILQNIKHFILIQQYTFNTYLIVAIFLMLSKNILYNTGNHDDKCVKKSVNAELFGKFYLLKTLLRLYFLRSEWIFCKKTNKTLFLVSIAKNSN